MTKFEKIIEQERLKDLETLKSWVAANCSTDVYFDGDEQHQYNQLLRYAENYNDVFRPVADNLNAPQATLKRMTPLQYAAQEGYDIFLRNANPSPEIINAQEPKNKNTALHLACGRAQLNTALVLLEMGANPEIKANNDLLPLHKTTFVPLGKVTDQQYVINKDLLFVHLYHKFPDAIRIVSSDNENFAHKVVVTGLAQATKLIISEQPELLRQAKNNGDYPIHAAVLNFHPIIVQYLLALPEQNTLKGHKDNTPLHLAAQSGNPQLLDMCLNDYAPLNEPNREGHTPLMMAKDLDTVEKLIRKGADPMIESMGDNVLTLAVANNQSAIASWLVEQGYYTQQQLEQANSEKKGYRRGVG